MTHAQYLEQWLSNGKTAEEYYEWSRLCGLRASHAYKDRQLCERFHLESIAELGTWPATEIPELRNWRKLNAYILEHCTNPAELALCYLELVGNVKADHTKAGCINDHLKPFPRTSFVQFGDANWLTDVSPSWFKHDGMPLDTQAQEISELFGKEVSIDDLIGFVRDFRKGKYRTPYEVALQQYETKLAELCGFRMTAKYAIHLAETSGLASAPEPVAEAELDAVPF